MNREELTSLINEVLDARAGPPTIPPEFTRWRGGARPVLFDTEVEVILRNGEHISEKAGAFDWDDDYHPRDIIAYRVLTDARAVEARELRAWFNEHAPTKFKQGGMVLYRGQLRVVAGVLPYNQLNKYHVVRNGSTDMAREEELTRYEEERGEMNYEILSRMREGYYLDADMVGGGHAATHLRVYRRTYLIGGCDANLLRHNP